LREIEYPARLRLTLDASSEDSVDRLQQGTLKALAGQRFGPLYGLRWSCCRRSVSANAVRADLEGAVALFVPPVPLATC
jgi:hypothetical protein